MNRRQKIIVSVTGIFLVLLILVGLTYAYFLTQIQGNEEEKSITVTTANLRLVYNDGSDGVIGGENIFPSDTEYIKTFTVKNEGNVNIDYAVYLIDVINTFERKDDIKYTMNCTTDGTLACGTRTSTTFPNGIHQIVTSTIEPNKTHTYTFKFTYKDTGTDQSVDMGKELGAKIQIFTKGTDGEYFPYEEGTLAYSVINNVKNGSLEGKTLFTANLDATGMVSTPTVADDKILSTAIDDYGTTYYFRGNPIDNYVNYAGMCWRIVRIQGDGSVKLILASELECSEDNLTDTSGFMTDGERGTKGVLLTPHYGEKIKNGWTVSDYVNVTEEPDTSARFQLMNWLNRKVTMEEQQLLKNETWCIGDLTNAYDNKGNNIGNIDEIFRSYEEYDKDPDNYLGEEPIWEFYYSTLVMLSVTKTPSYMCKNTGSVGEIDINKIGMLTPDEVVYAGGENTTNYLYNNSFDKWLLFSPLSYDNGTSCVSVLFEDGEISCIDEPYGLKYYYVKVRPSLTIKSGVSVSDGVGTINDPYIIG